MTCFKGKMEQFKSSYFDASQRGFKGTVTIKNGLV